MKALALALGLALAGVLAACNPGGGNDVPSLTEEARQPVGARGGTTPAAAAGGPEVGGRGQNELPQTSEPVPSPLPPAPSTGVPPDEDAVVSSPKEEPVPSPTFTYEDGLRLAHEFVLRSPTFRFDGMPETLELLGSETLADPNSGVFLFRFDSRQAGYGDRAGMIMAQVITPHEARVVVEIGEVTSAVLDGQWDMVNQRMLP